jgi:hypothetical protein
VIATLGPDSETEPPAGQADAEHGSGRIRSLMSGTRDLVRIVYRDPQHVSERLTLKFIERLGEPSLTWSQHVLTERGLKDRPAVAANLCQRSAEISAVDGAVAGTPFLLALLPGYLGYLWQEGVLVLRLAALYGRDPRDVEAAAEFLVLRGIHPDSETAREELERIRATPMPDKPSERRPIRNWYQSVRMLGVFGGFLSPPSPEPAESAHARLRMAAGIAVGAIIWALTWIFPVTFMLAMAWGCESHARSLGRRATDYYSGRATDSELESEVTAERRLARTVTLILSVALPIAFVAYADHVRNQTGVNAVGAAGAVVGLSLVIAMVVVARRI